MKKILNRLKSPVVIVQLVTIIGTLIVLLDPGTADTVKKIVTSITTVVNIFAGLNNPDDKTSF